MKAYPKNEVSAVPGSQEQTLVCDDSMSDTHEPTTSTEGADTAVATQVPDQPSSNNAIDPQIGDLISQRYRLERVLGEGGMGRVFLATDELYATEFKDRKSEVAIKFLGRKFAEHKSARMALQRETRKSQQLSHPNVVRVMHFDQHDGQPYMIMEYMRGRPLDEIIKGKGARGLPFDQALPMIEGMSAGLAYIHSQGLVHSDFKPNNIFLGDDGEIKILDLGIARANEDAQHKKIDTVFDVSALGALTPAYASCEMFEGVPPDPRDDIYALACVTYELLTGKHPFGRMEAIKARGRELKPEHPEGLSHGRWVVLEKGLAFDRANRLANVELLAVGMRGERARNRLIIGGLAASAMLAIVLSGSLGMLAMKDPNPDDAFLQALTPASLAPLSGGDMARVQRWLEQGTAYLDISEQEFSRGDLQSAHHILRGGPDNAYAAFARVLELTDSPEAKQGMLRMVNDYATWADKEAEAGDTGQALFAACEGLKIHPHHLRLNDIMAELKSELPEGAAAGC